jgi:hypothetical protein
MCLFTLPALAASSASSGCPTSPKNFLVAPNVAATFSNSGTTTTYTFISLTNDNPVNGVPGLVKYCVYPSPATDEPTSINVQAVGEDGSKWISRQDPKEFAFVRPGGNKTDIPLDGKTTTMGTATFNTLPTGQTILLHIADPAVCASTYPGTTSPTCFVKPNSLVSACNIGDGATTAAYNAIPFGGQLFTAQPGLRRGWGR